MNNIFSSQSFVVHNMKDVLRKFRNMQYKCEISMCQMPISLVNRRVSMMQEWSYVLLFSKHGILKWCYKKYIFKPALKGYLFISYSVEESLSSSTSFSSTTSSPLPLAVPELYGYYELIFDINTMQKFLVCVMWCPYRMTINSRTKRICIRVCCTILYYVIIQKNGIGKVLNMSECFIRM
jgi:hypothetical protein